MRTFRGVIALALACAAAASGHARAPADRLGDPAFDLPYGVNAINTGRHAEGVLALERYLLLRPDDEVARVELARGYFLLGDDARAREEFELALARTPPPAVVRVIREYLEQLARREARRKPTLVAWLEAATGYDSNPRAGVDNALITLPVIGEVTVPAAGVRAGDRTYPYAGGFRATMPVTPRTQFFASGQADIVRYHTERDFDQALFAGSAGFLGQWRAQSWRLGASRGYQTLARKAYRQTHGVFADWGLALDPRNAVSVGVQAGRLEYAGTNAVRDSDFAVVTAGWRRGFAGAWRPQLEAAVNAGRERNANDRDDLSRDLFGARLGVAIAPAADWLLAASAVHQVSRYLEPDAVLETTREDRYSAGELGVSWQVTPGLTLRAEFSEAKNESNLALYEYRRSTAILRGRYEFR